jgi:hypothetical protein
MAKEVKRFATPEGRLFYGHVFERNIYVDEKGREGDPTYSATIGVDPTEAAELIDAALLLATENFGKDVQLDIDGGTIKTPFKWGDAEASRREARGKEGGATKGLLLIKATTQYNASGDMAAGGIQVFDENALPITIEQKDTVYNGSYGVIVLTMSAYTVSGTQGIKFYLSAYQKTKDGERLGGGDVKALLKPGRAAATANVAPIRRQRV